MSEFTKACYAGDMERVQTAIAAARVADGAEPVLEAAAAVPLFRPDPPMHLRRLFHLRARPPLPPRVLLLVLRCAICWSVACRCCVCRRCSSRLLEPALWDAPVETVLEIGSAWCACSSLTALESGRWTSSHRTRNLRDGHRDFDGYLLESPLDGGCGMSANARNRACMTALHDAVMSMRIDLVRLLVEFGDADPYAADPDGITPRRSPFCSPKP